jgi:hypothetical protein
MLIYQTYFTFKSSLDLLYIKVAAGRPENTRPSPQSIQDQCELSAAFSVEISLRNCGGLFCFFTL